MSCPSCGCKSCRCGYKDSLEYRDSRYAPGAYDEDTKPKSLKEQIRALKSEKRGLQAQIARIDAQLDELRAELED
jgi:multidrug resistance efflux pump